MNEKFLKQIKDAYDDCSCYDLIHIGLGIHAPIKLVVFKVYDDVGLPSFYAAEIESWVFDDDCDDLQFEDFKDDLYEVEPKTKEIVEWVSV